jgi:hypothetical protein
MVRTCPPGMICMSNTLLLGILGVLVVLCVLATLYKQTNVVVRMDSPHPLPASVLPVVVPGSTINSRFEQAPEPLRDWMGPPELPPRGTIGLRTRGFPEAFQTIGNLSVGGGKMLPLYGRRSINGSSDRWNYYTRTNEYNPVPLPLRHKNRDCMDDIGCPEVFSGDSIHVDGTGEKGLVRLFNMNGPRYFPGFT